MMIVRYPLLTVFVQGQGSWLTDKEGKEYLDFVQGWAVNCLGHSHPAMVKAISGQAGKLINASPAYFTDRLLELAQKIVDHSAMDKVFFTNSGAEANEGAIKLARKWGQVHRSGAHEIVTMHDSFHGRTLATMSASGKPKWESLFEPEDRHSHNSKSDPPFQFPAPDDLPVLLSLFCVFLPLFHNCPNPFFYVT